MTLNTKIRHYIDGLNFLAESIQNILPCFNFSDLKFINESYKKEIVHFSHIFGLEF